MKYDLGQTIWYIFNEVIRSAPILSRMIIENSEKASTPEQKEIFEAFGESTIKYATCHTIVEECEAFGSRLELLQALLKHVKECGC